MEKTQIDTLMLAIAGLDTKLSAKIDQGFAEVNKELVEVKQSLDMIAAQTSKTVG